MSEGSSYEDYQHKELDELIQNEFFDSLDLGDENVEMMMILGGNGEESGAHSELQGFSQREESCKPDSVAGARLLYEDYFQPGSTFHNRFFRRRFRMRKPLSCTWWRE